MARTEVSKTKDVGSIPTTPVYADMMELAYILVSNTRFFGFDSRYRYYREHGVMVAHYIRVVEAEFESHVFV